ncbi:PAS domain-containing protein [Caminibacter pacificus]|uniref:Aerotaxis receptor n=1 Tax=Caminibacter pacificus TaxID=1424653 RepID=A0AAJ4RDI0_9BACT|nr:PAS domain-containing protein [Caminibacter pacificus]QCI27539.1 PAS domain S-box protein [Caminibacter pacificus]ROR40283.1 aerotaxis receptor [Caminibacter pacificus]
MKIKPINEEVRFEDVNPTERPVVSKTDIRGIITYTNSMFRALSGYEKGEMIGRPHNIVRHPDMPKKVFEEMWDTILNGKKWSGIIKNLRKDGRYYWVEAFIEPIFDENGKIIGFVSARRKVSDELKKEYEKIYQKMREENK